jgi:hypothetical protein
MDNSQFDRLVMEFRDQQDRLISSKGHDYTIANEDRLFNFKFVAELLGITPLQVCGVYWLKHILAIVTYINKGRLESDERIEGRLLDAANYGLLALALIKEADPKSIR